MIYYVGICLGPPVERCGSFLHSVQEAAQWEVALQLSFSGVEWYEWVG